MSDGVVPPSGSGTPEWDAETYDAVSDPQFNWGLEVLDRIELNGEERVLDAGCGSGRVTEQLLARLADPGQLVALDGSSAMIAKARERLGQRPAFVVADLAEFELARPVDLVFSTATFHWLPDHDRLFARLRAALVPGGRLVAQCGGAGNVAAHTEAIARVAARPEFAAELGDEDEKPWNFATPEQTEARLGAAGFEDVRCWLEPKPVTPDRPLDFIATVTVGPILAKLPEGKRRPFAEAVLAESGEPLTLDYVRLNIEAAAGPSA